MAISDKEGRTFGGHVSENCRIAFTAELVICEDESVTYHRELDEQTGFPELIVQPRV